MKFALMMLCTLAVAFPLHAAEPPVDVPPPADTVRAELDSATPSAETLKKLGLVDLKPLTEKQELEVRGASASAISSGGSLVVAVLTDPQNPLNFLILVDSNVAGASSSNAGLNTRAAATAGPTGSSVQGQLQVMSGNPAIQSFFGQAFGGAGRGGNPLAGISAASAGW